MGKGGAEKALKVSDAMQRLKRLKHGAAGRRPPSFEEANLTEPDRAPTVELVPPQPGESLSSDEPQVGGATAAGTVLPFAESAQELRGTGGITATSQPAGLSVGNWIGIIGVALAVLALWVSLATYFHGDLKTDLRDLREGMEQGDQALRESTERLREELQGVERQVRDLAGDGSE